MRINVHKYLVFGPQSQRVSFFKQAQRLGSIQFKKCHAVEQPADVQLFIDALHVLRRMVPKKEAQPAELFSPNMMARQIVEHNERLEHLQEQERILQKEFDRIAPFGEFSLEKLHSFEQSTGWCVQFFCAKQGKIPNLDETPNLIKITTHSELDYYLSVSKKKFSLPHLIEFHFETSLQEIAEKIAQTHREMDHHEMELVALSHHKSRLINGLRSALNHADLDHAQLQTEGSLEETLFSAQAWIPDSRIEEVEELARTHAVVVERIAVEEEDRVPTYLENKGIARLGEDLVGIYDTPSITDRDPSLWVFGSFALFFSMIIADVGYGLILFLLSSVMLFKFREKKGALKRFLKLTFYLSLGCLFWGSMVTSFFGIDIDPDSSLRSISLIHWMTLKKAAYFIAEKPAAYLELLKQHPQLSSISSPLKLLMGVHNTAEGATPYPLYEEFTRAVLIELSLFVGVVHLALSFLRYLDRNWAGLGWIAAMVGGYLFFPTYLHSISLIHYVFGVPYELGGVWGQYILYGGLAGAVGLALLQFRLAGLAEIMQVIGVFADVMSYLRIYALSLAGMIMASTFDHIGTSVPLAVGIFIILAGHLVNFTLALMGGVIHGLRLNFIEWYHYSFEGGGVQFSPLYLRKEE